MNSSRSLRTCCEHARGSFYSQLATQPDILPFVGHGDDATTSHAILPPSNGRNAPCQNTSRMLEHTIDVMNKWKRNWTNRYVKKAKHNNYDKIKIILSGKMYCWKWFSHRQIIMTGLYFAGNRKTRKNETKIFQKFVTLFSSLNFDLSTHLQ